MEPKVFKSPLKLAQSMVKQPLFEAGKYDKNGQVIDKMAKYFDTEDEAVNYALINGFDYVTGYEYKDENDSIPKSSYEVWKRENDMEEE